MVLPVILFDLPVELVVGVLTAREVEYHVVPLVLLFDEARDLGEDGVTSSMEFR